MDAYGYVEPGLEQVKKVFENTDFGPGGGAFAVYRDGRPVVDLWIGNAGPGRQWQEDTRAVLMSATKGLTTTCAAILVDRGLLDIDAPVGDYWPAFACNGKEGTLVRHILSHTSGVVHLPGYERLRWDGTGWDEAEQIAADLASAEPAWAPGTDQGYHALTYGWLVGELIRRVTGKTLGQFFYAEIAVPLGLDVAIGTRAADVPRVATVIDAPLGDELPPELAQVLALWEDPTSVPGKAFFAGPDGNVINRIADLMNSPKALAAELGGSNGTGTARSMARLYGALACGGEIDGVRIVSPETIELFNTDQSRGPDRTVLVEFRWALGYLKSTGPQIPGLPNPFGPHDEAFGHNGLGGQLCQADPVEKLGIGFVRNYVETPHITGAVLVDALYSSL